MLKDNSSYNKLNEKLIKNKEDKRMINAKIKPDYSKTDKGFTKTKVQRLDEFITKQLFKLMILYYYD